MNVLISCVMCAVLPAAVDSQVESPDKLGERALAGVIDGILEREWARAGLTPAPPASDAEFFRRASLDITGRSPLGSEARAFLDDAGPDKRREAVDRLLASPAFAEYQAGLWSEILIPDVMVDSEVRAYEQDFKAWLRGRIEQSVGYDSLAREILTASVEEGLEVFDLEKVASVPPRPFAFIGTKRGRPELLAAGAASVFLGIRLECAQCHDHPFDRWTREDFWRFSAFFAGIEHGIADDGTHHGSDEPLRHTLTIPGTDKIVDAAFLDGTVPDWSGSPRAREVLADWVTARTNPFFARAAVNRIWAQFFGEPLIGSEGDEGSESEPWNLAILEVVSKQFASHEFDIKYLFRSIALTRAYQLSSRADSSGQGSAPGRRFLRMRVRALTATQFYRSLARAGGLPRGAGSVYYGDPALSDLFEQFPGGVGDAEDHQVSIAQALIMMNGQHVAEATSPTRGRTLAAIADAPFLDDADRLEALFLSTLGRRPRPQEEQRLASLLREGTSPRERGEVLADIFWSLIASAEFMTNH